MEKKSINILSKDILNLKKKINNLLKNPKKNFNEINSIYQKLLINYYYLRKQGINYSR